MNPAGEPEPAPPVTEPDLYNPRCGTDDRLLGQVRDMWRNSPGGGQ